jgi:iron complex outermembrane recepter protein
MNERVVSPQLVVRRSVLQLFALVFAIHLTALVVAVADEGPPAAAPPSQPAPTTEQKDVVTPAVTVPPETTPPPAAEQPAPPPVKLTPVAQPEEKKVATAGPTVEKLTPVVVTGSLLPTTETVGPAPVNTITAAEIEKTGAQDVLALVKQLDPTFVGNFNVGRTLDNGGFGEANVEIHNLQTLVLLNGHRLGNSAFSNGALVDLNTIPVAAIERIEVLKDGSSALYGSEAIGGVVNIITKKDFSETDIDGYFGEADGKGSYDEERASVVSGFVTDRGEFTVAGQWFHSNPLLTTDRSIASLSFDALTKHGIDATSVSYMSPSFPGKVESGDGTDPNGPNFNPAVSYYLTGYATPPVLPGQSFSGPNAVVNYNNAVVASGQAAPYSTTPTALTPDGFLNTTEFKDISIQQQDRRNFFGDGTYDLIGKQAQIFGEFLYANQESIGSLAPSPVIGLGTKQSNIDIPADNPYNPFGIDLGPGAGTNGLPPDAPRIRSRFWDSGDRIFDSQSDYYHIVAGLKGEFDPGYTYNASYTYNRYDQIQFTKNAINGAALDLALQPNSDPTLAAQGLSQLVGAAGTFVPVYDIFSYAGHNSPATLDAIRTTLFESGMSESWDAAGIVTGSPLELPGGKLGIAVGGDVRSDALSIDFDGLTRLGLVPGLNAELPTQGTRDSYDFYAEVRIPLTSPDNHIFGLYSSEVTAAGRFESFSPGGDDAVPKVAIRWQPVDEQVTMRANYAQSFRAPTTYELFGGSAQSQPGITGGDGQTLQETVSFVSNKGLKAVKGENYGFGVVFQPKAIKHLTVSVDYYHVKTHNDIFRVDQQAITDDLNAKGSASKYASLYTFADGSKLTSTTPNQVVDATWGSLDLPLENGAKTQTDGLDMSATYVLPTQVAGTFTFYANADLTFQYLFSDPVIGGPFEYKGQYTDVQVAPGAQGLIPDYSINTGLAWDIQNWTYAINSRYIPSVQDKGYGFPFNNETFTTLPTAKAPDGPTWTVDSWFDIDMQLSYEFGKGRPMKDWYDATKITVGVNNITGEAPPLISSSSEDNTDKSTYDIIGRFVYFEVSKKF